MKRIAGVIIVIALMAPSIASAQGGSTCQAYNPQLCTVVGTDAHGGTGTGTATTADSAGTLPFTGLDLVLVAAGGGALLGAGLVVRRLSRNLN